MKALKLPLMLWLGAILTERRIQKVRKDSGEPIPGMKYTLHLPDGGLRRGVTDAEGFTEVIESKHLQTIKIHFEDPD